MLNRALILLIALLSSVLAFADNSKTKQKMLADIDFYKSVFEVIYGPKEWKNKYAGWDLETEIQKAKDKVNATADITTKQYQFILKELFLSTRDYHVGVMFHSTEKASLPFQIKGAGSRYFLAYINRDKLPVTSFPFNVGDELVEFDGMPTHDAVMRYKVTIKNGEEATDKALAEARLTMRTAAWGIDVPKGPVSLLIKPKGSSKAINHQLIWEYTPEIVSQPTAVKTFKAKVGESNLLNRPMISYAWDEFKTSADEENPHYVTARKSFVPELGKKIWESKPEDLFHAYIFQSADKKLVGYVRIPTYFPTDPAAYAKAFADLVTLFETTTDSLVIDQLNNNGGWFFYMYALASMLTDQSLFTPKHRMTINQADVQEAADNIPALEKVKNDAEARKVIGETVTGFPVNFETARSFLDDYRFIVNEWNAGRKLTLAHNFAGFDHINSNPTTHYTKPILLLINSLDFSCADFFPAIMQDNKRAKLMGTRTAGAGGYVLRFSHPNPFGVAGFSLTGSIAERLDLNPIENLGVTPDIPYELTENDLQNNYEDYVKAIQAALSGL